MKHRVTITIEIDDPPGTFDERDARQFTRSIFQRAGINETSHPHVTWEIAGTLTIPSRQEPP